MAGVRAFLARLNDAPRRRDALAAVAYLLVGLALLIALGGRRLWQPAVIEAPPGAFIATLVVIVAVATQRSTRPLSALAAGAVVAAVDLVLGGSLGVVIVFADLVYCAFRYGSDRALRIVLAANAVVWGGLAVAALVWEELRAQFAQTALQGVLIVMVGASWGWSVRSERTRTRASAEREHAEATRRMRQRIAHDLHDRVANQIAVAGLNVEAALLRMRRDADPAAARSLERATAGTDSAHRQLRQLIAVLNSVDGPDEADDRVGDLRDIGELVPTGRALRWRPDDARRAIAPLEPTARTAVVRALRELVANAVRHGNGDVSVEADATSIRVANAVAAAPRAVAGNGIGIVGAATLLAGSGGAIESGPSDGGWRAVIRLPAAGDGHRERGTQ